MNTSILSYCLLALAVSTQPAVAQSTKPADKGPSAQAAPMSPAEFDKRVAQMQEDMKQMQAQMDKIRQTQDPKERQRLLQEHWTSMQTAMSTMNGMWGLGACCATGGGMGPGMMMGGQMMGWGQKRDDYSKLTPEQLRQRQYMMDQYMPMQQMMMDQMMRHQHWTTQPPAQPK